MLGRTSVFLIGPMGSGKTAVGRQLARVLGVPFYDSDAEVERRTGVDIPFIFEKEGEAGFRVREREALQACILYPLREPRCRGVSLDRLGIFLGGGVRVRNVA